MISKKFLKKSYDHKRNDSLEIRKLTPLVRLKRLKFKSIATNTEEIYENKQNFGKSSTQILNSPLRVSKKYESYEPMKIITKKNLTPRVRLRFYDPQPPIFRKKKTICQLLNYF